MNLFNYYFPPEIKIGIIDWMTNVYYPERIIIW